MPSSFWNNTLTEEKNTGNIENNFIPEERIHIKRNIPTEDMHELAIDIYESDDKIHIIAALAGVKSKDISISIDAETIFISGSRTNPFKEYEDKLYSSECFWGKFERKFTLPSSADTRNISATFRNGILLIEASRITPAGERQIIIH